MDYEMKEEIKERSEMTDYLETVFVNEALRSFEKRKSLSFSSNNNINKKYCEYLSYFSRVWLNYLPREYFESFLLRKLENEVFNNRYEKNQIFK